MISIKITFHSYFDSGDGLELKEEIVEVDDWYTLIRELIKHFSEYPVLPDNIDISFSN